MKWLRNRFYDYKNKSDLIKEYFLENDEPVEMWNDIKIKEYHEKALKQVLNYVYQNNKYYRQKFDKLKLIPNLFESIEELSKYPMLKKDDIRGQPYKILSTFKENISQVHLSTGTTGGEPIYMLHTWNDLFLNDITPEMPLLFPVKKGEVVINALPYEMSSAGLSFHRVLQDGTQSMVIPVGKGGFYSNPIKTLMIMKKMKATTIITTPSYIMYLAELADKINLKPDKDFCIEKIWLTGEGCSNAFRKRIEKIWNAKGYFYYGSLECGVIGIECSEQNGYHLAEGHIYVEIVDTVTGKNLEPGMIGEIVVTTLLREGSPLVRYRTQDLGFIEDMKCKCGVKRKRLFLRGRKCDQIEIDGKKYSPIYIEEQLMRIPEVGNNYKIYIKEDGVEILLKISKGYEANDLNAMKVESILEYNCGLKSKVIWTNNIGYEGGKTIRVVNLKNNE